MKMRLLLAIMLLSVIGTSVLFAEHETTGVRQCVADFINNAWSPRQFTAGIVSDEVLQQVLSAGHKAPSGMNRQPWHFTVVRNKALIDQILQNVNDGEVLIVISNAPNDVSRFAEFDCALATQNMFLVAQALGYASRIYAMPVQNINDKLLSTLKVPDGFKALMVLRIGKLADGVDATTSASPRADLDSKVNFID